MPKAPKLKRYVYVNAPAGNDQGVIVDIVDVGIVETGKWGPKHKVRIVAQLGTTITRENVEDAFRAAGEIPNEDDFKQVGKPFLVNQQYTFSLGKEANLRRAVKQIRGHDLSAEEERLAVRGDLDLDDLILGHNVQVTVVHNVDKADPTRTFSNIEAFGKWNTKFGPAIQPHNYVRVQDRTDG